MAAVTHLVTTADSGNTPNTSGAFTPAEGDLLVVVITCSASTSEVNTELTSSLAGLTFENIDAANTAASADRVLVYFASAKIRAADVVSQTVTYSPGDAGTGSVITVYGVSGMSKVGNNAIRQRITQENQAAGGTPTATFSAAVLTTNPTIVVVGNASNPAGLTAPTGWTEPVGADTGYDTPTTGQESVFRDSGFTGTTITYGSTSATAFGLVAVELDAAASTRLYFSRTSSPLSLPAPNAGWEHTGSGGQFGPWKLLATPDGNAITGDATTYDAADDLVDKDALHSRYVSDPLEAQTISGEFAAVVQCLEANAGNNLNLAIRIFVVSTDGTTEKEELYAIAKSDAEMLTTIRGDVFFDEALVSATLEAGDRIVVELGASGLPVAAAGVQDHDHTIYNGGSATSNYPDLPQTFSYTGADKRPWIEFDGTITFEPTADGGVRFRPIHTEFMPRTLGTILVR